MHNPKDGVAHDVRSDWDATEDQSLTPTTSGDIETSYFDPPWADTPSSDPKIKDLTISDLPPRIELVNSGHVLRDAMSSEDKLAPNRKPEGINVNLCRPPPTGPAALDVMTMQGEDGLTAVLHEVAAEEKQDNTKKRGPRFWFCIIALMMASFLIVLDMVYQDHFIVVNGVALMWILLQTGIGTALPTIVNDLHGTEFEWVGSAYGLASTAFLPLSGALAQVRSTKQI